jgi:RNA ligase
MLHYEFPKIKHIDDIKEVLNKPEFILVKKDGYQVVNYMFQDRETFQTPIEAECRGLIFDMEGNLISRRYHKFFNVGERDDVVPDLSKPHVILDKLDGSMVSPLWLNVSSEYGEGYPDELIFRMITKMGITDVSMQAEEFIQDKSEYTNLIKFLYPTYTAIFEWCSRKNRVVLDYPNDALVLTAVRRNSCGTYMSYNRMKELVNTKISVVKHWEGNSKTLEEHLDYFRNLQNEEGVIVRFDDGHMVKIKSEWYLQLHRTKDAISNEAKVLSLVINQGLDDLLPLLTEDDKKKVLDYQQGFYTNLLKITDNLINAYKMIRLCTGSRKEFAEHVSKDPNADLLFKIYDLQEKETKNSWTLNVPTVIINKIKKRMKRLDEVRSLIGVEFKPNE